MGLKDIFKKDEETLVIDRTKQAIKALIILGIVLVIALIILFVLTSIGDVDETRREYITKDIQNIQNYVKNKANDLRDSTGEVVYPGTSLEEEPRTLTINGITEEYRYGYYYLTPTDYADIGTALNLTNEHYIVNYDTYDVVNVAGIKYNRKIYHSVNDLVAIEKGQLIPSEHTIIINVPADMQKMHTNPAGTFKLAANIDMEEYKIGEGWYPVQNFSGTIDGRGYTIKNLTINRPTQPYVGLIANAQSNARIANLTLENVNIVGEEYTGSLAGTMAGNVTNVKVIGGNVKGIDKVGGLVGSHQQGTITNCKVQLSRVAGENQIGGAVGILNSGVIQQVVATVSSINATSSAGGFAGSVSASTPAYMLECTSTSDIYGISDSLGGLIGRVDVISENSSFDLKNCYSKGNINTGVSNMGGLVGYVRIASGTTLEMRYLYTTVNVLNKTESAGGCIGYSDVTNTATSIIQDVFWEKNLAPGEVLNGLGKMAPSTVMISFSDKTSDEMLLRTTFGNFDLAKIWEMKERISTPTLSFEKGLIVKTEKDK